MAKTLVFTSHAQTRLKTRSIETKWIEETVINPDWTEQEPYDPAIERRFRKIEHFGNRILRVTCVETNSTIRIIKRDV